MSITTVLLILVLQSATHFAIASAAVKRAKRRGRMEGEVEAIEQIRGQMQAADMRRKVRSL